MRREHSHKAAGAQQAVQLCHGLHEVVEVLDDGERVYGVEGAVPERIREGIQVHQYGRFCFRQSVYRDPNVLTGSGPKVQHAVIAGECAEVW
jgi:hypothetical protein